MNENEIKSSCNAPENEYHGLRFLLKLTFQMKYWILMSVAILVVASFIILKNITPQYERQIALRVEPQESLCVQDSCAHDVLLSQISLRDETEPIRVLLQSNDIMDSAESIANLQGKVSLERQSLSVSSTSKSAYIIYLKCKTENPENADAFLKALAESYNQYFIRHQKEQLTAKISACDEMLNILSHDTNISLDSLNDNQAFIYSKIQNNLSKEILINELEKEKASYCTKYIHISPVLSVVNSDLNDEAPIFPKAKFFYLLAVVLGFFIPLLVAEIINSRKNRNFAA